MNTLIPIRRVRFFVHNNFRMRVHEITVVEGDMTNDTESVGHNTEHKNLAKMSIDISRFNF